MCNSFQSLEVNTYNYVNKFQNTADFDLNIVDRCKLFTQYAKNNFILRDGRSTL